MKEHIVKSGECFESIAVRYGYLSATLWDHPANDSLREERKNPNVLLTGDVVHIPNRQLKQENGATEQRHRFRRKGVPSSLNIVLQDENGAPRGNLAYVLNIEGQTFEGKTTAKGKLKHAIPPNAVKGKLIVNPGGEQEERYELQIGHLDPANSATTGVQGRLRNLGYDCGKIDNRLSPETENAIRAFQADHGLEATGQVDDRTLSALEQEYGY